MLATESRYRSSLLGALLAVNLGDDADTTGAVYGQIAGAFYGEDGIPAEWRAKLAMRDKIEALADGLYEIQSHTKPQSRKEDQT